ncbi:MAG: hypothetical protein R2942_03775 [Ignavibacteria bacterium]
MNQLFIKRGYALRIMIDSVLRSNGCFKVILLGHSMGGLAIREYLQRKENGIVNGGLIRMIQYPVTE